MVNQKIRIKLKSYDHNLIDKSAEKIVNCKWSNTIAYAQENIYSSKISSRE